MSSGASAAEVQAQNSVDALAASIYVELVGRAFLRVENNPVIKPEPAVLAALSFKLAAMFKAAEKAAHAESGPKNVGYDVQISDITGWEK